MILRYVIVTGVGFAEGNGVFTDGTFSFFVISIGIATGLVANSCVFGFTYNTTSSVQVIVTIGISANKTAICTIMTASGTFRHVYGF